MLLFSALAAHAEQPLWAWDLENQAVGAAPEFGEGLEIREENGRKILSKPERGQTFFLEPKSLPSEAKDWRDIVFRVQYREPEKSELSLVVKSFGQRSEADYWWYYVAIGRDDITIYCHQLSGESLVDPADSRLRSTVTYEEMGGQPLTPGEWTTATVEVGDAVLKVSVDNGDGATRKAEFKVLPGTGRVSILSHKPVDIAAATVHQADAPVTASE